MTVGIYQFNLAQTIKWIKYRRISDKQEYRHYLNLYPWKFIPKVKPTKPSKAKHLKKLIKYMQRSSTGV